MTTPEELWGTRVRYELLDLRGKRARLLVPARAAAAYLVVHRGRVTWNGGTPQEPCVASIGETVEIAPGGDVAVEAHDAVCEYFAQPDDLALRVTVAPDSGVEVTVE